MTDFVENFVEYFVEYFAGCSQISLNFGQIAEADFVCLIGYFAEVD